MPSLEVGEGRVYPVLGRWRWACRRCGMQGSADTPNEAEDGLVSHLEVVHPED